MARRVVWSSSALIELEKILKYWNSNNKSSAYSRKIKRSINQSIKILKIYPMIGRSTNYADVRAKAILDNFLLLYKISSSNEIIILNFWDGRQNPEENEFLRQQL